MLKEIIVTTKDGEEDIFEKTLKEVRKQAEEYGVENITFMKASDVTPDTFNKERVIIDYDGAMLIVDCAGMVSALYLSWECEIMVRTIFNSDIMDFYKLHVNK